MKVLYLSYTGLLEPLGRSQVLTYLLELSEQHSITVISFEKRSDLANSLAVSRLAEECAAARIAWRPRLYHQRPRLVATGFDTLFFFWSAVFEVLRSRIQVVHARSYVAAFVAWAMWRLGGPPFLFDMRALWLDEMIEAGRLKPGSWLHRTLQWAERRCLIDAAAVVSLTQAAVPHLLTLTNGKMRQPVAVIPTCVDLDRFSQVQPSSALHDGQIRVGCVGTVLSGWFLTSWLATFFRAAADRWPDAQFEIVSRDDPDEVRAALAHFIGPLAAQIRCRSAAFDEVPGLISALDAGALFFATGLSRLGSCPTRMGEFLAAGRPIVANAGVGDFAQVIRERRVGVIVTSDDPAAMAQACDDLAALLADPGIGDRCRQTAMDLFSHQRGVATYDELYRRMAAASRNSPEPSASDRATAR